MNLSIRTNLTSWCGAICDGNSRFIRKIEGQPVSFHIEVRCGNRIAIGISGFNSLVTGHRNGNILVPDTEVGHIVCKHQHTIIGQFQTFFVYLDGKLQLAVYRLMKLVEYFWLIIDFCFASSKASNTVVKFDGLTARNSFVPHALQIGLTINFQTIVHTIVLVKIAIVFWQVVLIKLKSDLMIISIINS